MNFETLAIHAGQEIDPQTGAVMVPIYQTSTFAQKNPGQDPYMYSRAGNPTRTALEQCLAAVEGAKHGLAFASGMSATDAALRLLLPGDHVVTSDDVYGGTFRIFTHVYQPYGISFSFVEDVYKRQMRNDALAHDHPLTTFLLELQRLDRLRELPLAPLDAVETTSLAESVAEQRLDASQRERLFAATEGNPLFIVETMRVQLGNASTVATPLALPPKVQAVIRARLAQLSSLAHELVQVAAVIGRSFQVDLLTAVVDQDLDAVVRSLDELWQRRIVREQGISNYDFSHDRLREVAYACLLYTSARRTPQLCCRHSPCPTVAAV